MSFAFFHYIIIIFFSFLYIYIFILLIYKFSDTLALALYKILLYNFRFIIYKKSFDLIGDGGGGVLWPSAGDDGRERDATDNVDSYHLSCQTIMMRGCCRPLLFMSE